MLVSDLLSEDHTPIEIYFENLVNSSYKKVWRPGRYNMLKFARA
jgi:hypothetical protein